MMISSLVKLEFEARRSTFPGNGVGFGRLVSIFVCLAAVLILVSSPAQARVYIDIDQPLAKKIPVAIPDFVPISQDSDISPEISQGLVKRLGDNLDLLGMFVILDKRTFLETNVRAGLSLKERINFKEWLAIGSELLIKGAFTIYDDKLSLELRLFDVFEGRMLLGKRYTGHREDAGQMINRFSNEIIYILTGERGIFGTRIAFQGVSRGRTEIFLTEFGSGEVSQLTRSPGASSQQTFSRDGREMVYLTRTSGGYRLTRLALGGKARVIYSGSRLYLTPCFTPDGGLLASISGKHATHIYRLGAKGQPSVPITSLGSINISPTLSPDGAQMAYVSNRAGGPQIYISPVNGGSHRRLSLKGKENTDPWWSPRGDRIVFVGRTRDGDLNIFTINPDGTDLQQLTSGMGRNTAPTWSPDGRMIVFASTRLGRNMIFTMTANGERQSPLIPDYKGAQSSPVWSPARKK